MAKKEVFMCDTCGKQSSPNSSEDLFPYTQGWRSLTNFEFKISSEYKHEAIMKHFCSNECFVSFMARFIHEQEEILEEKRMEFFPKQEPKKNPLLNPILRDR